MRSMLLECKNLVFGYAAKKASARDAGLVAPVNFGLDAGEVVALMGQNGCGKSTFLKTLCGLLEPVSGTVKLLGRPLWSADGSKVAWSARERAKVVAIVRMGGVVSDRMTVREFVGLGRTPYSGLFDGRTKEDECVIDDAIALLNLGKFSDRWMTELSDGERSRVYLAQAIAQQVKVLLLDEPNAFLDIPRSRKLFALLQMLSAERGMGILVSTHSVEYAERYCGRLAVIENGILRCERTCDARAKGLLDWTDVCG